MNVIIFFMCLFDLVFYDLLSCIINIGKYEFKAHSICSEVFSFVVLGPLVQCAVLRTVWFLEQSL